jgi:hypothetical protein
LLAGRTSKILSRSSGAANQYRAKLFEKPEAGLKKRSRWRDQSDPEDVLRDPDSNEDYDARALAHVVMGILDQAGQKFINEGRLL